MKTLKSLIHSFFIVPALCGSLVLPGFPVVMAQSGAPQFQDLGLAGAPVIDGGGSCNLYPIANYPQCEGGCGPCPAQGNLPAIPSSWVFTGQGQSGGCKTGYRMITTSPPGAPFTAFLCEKIVSSEEIVGGPYNRTYNGLRPDGDAQNMDGETYLAKSMELASALWGVTEVGQKLCKPMGSKHAQSLVDWWYLMKSYVNAEKARDSLLRRRIEVLNAEMVKIQRGDKSELQLKAIEFQIQSINMMLDSISGSTLFDLDQEATVARATARLPWRENLLVGAARAAVKNESEDVKNGEVYKACIGGIGASRSAAAAGCARKKKVQDCSPGAKPTDPPVCVEREVPDPVPGSCEMVSSLLPALESGPVKNLADAYMAVPAPTIAVNGRIINNGKIIEATIAGFPVSSDSRFDWTSPLNTCKQPMMDVVKDNGILCPSDAKPETYDKVTVDKIAASANMEIDGSNVDACTNAVNSNMGVAKAACERTKTTTSSQMVSMNNCAGGECLDYQNVTTTTTVADPVPGSCEAYHEIFPAMLNGSYQPLSAVEGCKRTKEVPITTYDWTQTGCTDADAERCSNMIQRTTQTVADPVPGSCEQRVTVAGSLNEMKALLALPPQQSVADKLNLVGAVVTAQAKGVKSSSDASFNWSQNLGSCLKTPMAVATTTQTSTVESQEVAQTTMDTYQIPPVNTVSESAKSFLMTMGVYEPALQNAIAKFKENWNTTDLYLAQPNARKAYFTYAQKLLGEMIEADHAKVKQLVADRQKLLDLYARMKEMLNQGATGGGLAGNGGNGNNVINGNLSGVNPGSTASSGSNNASATFGTDSQDSIAGATIAPINTRNAGTFSSNNSAQVTGGGRGSSGSTLPSQFAGRDSSRSYAVSKYTKDQLEKARRSQSSSKSGSSMSSQLKKNANSDTNTVAAKIRKTMASTMSGKIDTTNAKILNDALSGVAPAVSDSAYSNSSDGSRSSSYGSSYGYGTGGGSGSSQGNFRKDPGSAGGAANSNANGSSLIRSGSYSTNGKAGAGGKSSFATAANSAAKGANGYNSVEGVNGLAGSEPTEYRKIPKPDLFKKISNRYNSSRNKLGLDDVEEDENEN